MNKSILDASFIFLKFIKVKVKNLKWIDLLALPPLFVFGQNVRKLGFIRFMV